MSFTRILNRPIPLEVTQYTITIKLHSLFYRGPSPNVKCYQ